jgi:hypothetical protein
LLILDPLSEALIKLGLSGVFKFCGKGFTYAFHSLTETFGIERSQKYLSVSEFWYEGVDKHGLSSTAKVMIEGVVSLYIPACPRHPRSVPGKRVETWLNLRGPVKDFATKDFVLWNDGILAPPKAGSNKAIIGLVDKYGFVGQGGLPLIVDLGNSKLRSVYEKLIEEKPVGYEAKVTGRLVPFYVDLIKDFGLIPPQVNDIAGLEYPNFVLETFEIKLLKKHTILTGTMWIGLKNETIFPIYCDLLDRDSNMKALGALSEEYGRQKRNVIAVHDPSPFTKISPEGPALNTKLIEVFRKI